MLDVCYSLDEAVDISGTQKEVESFRQKILKFMESDLGKIHIDIEKNIKPEPWDFVANGLEVIKNEKPVEVSISDDGIIKIKGSKSNLENFTSFLYFDEDAVSRSHSHFEYYEGHEEWISPDSFSLIIGIK